MDSILKIFIILVLLINYSSARSIKKWSITNDPSLINECLKKSLKYLSLRQDIIKTFIIDDVKNLICQTRINNGVTIKLTFTLEEQTWQCILYKSIVQTLSIEYERCDRIENEVNQNNDRQQINKQVIDKKSDCLNKTDNQQPFDMHANRNSDEEY